LANKLLWGLMLRHNSIWLRIQMMMMMIWLWQSCWLVIKRTNLWWQYQQYCCCSHSSIHLLHCLSNTESLLFLVVNVVSRS